MESAPKSTESAPVSTESAMPALAGCLKRRSPASRSNEESCCCACWASRAASASRVTDCWPSSLCA
eukprot:scaffold31257_cov27-Tisochrysis_lutea.AAC.1